MSYGQDFFKKNFYDFRQLSDFSESSEILYQSEFWAAPTCEILHLIFCWLFWSYLTTPSSSLLCWTTPVFEVENYVKGDEVNLNLCLFSIFLANINRQQCVRPGVSQAALSSQQHRSLLLYWSNIGHQHWKVRAHVHKIIEISIRKQYFIYLPLSILHFNIDCNNIMLSNVESDVNPDEIPCL